MGVKERKEKARAQMRETIVRSAHDLFIERGFHEVSMRNIAKAIEYSPATIYLYFETKTDIFYAIHREAFEKFTAYIIEVADVEDPFERLIRMTEKYVQYAIDHPKYYRIIFIMDSPWECKENSEEWEEGNKALTLLENVLLECQIHGRFKGQNIYTLAFSIWSYLHGMCSLALGKRLRRYSGDVGKKIPIESLNEFKAVLSKL